MESALKGLTLAAGIILTCIVIGVGFLAAREARATAAVSTQQISEFKKELEEAQITKFDGVCVTGSDVINFIKRQLSQYDIEECAPVYIQVNRNRLQSIYKNKGCMKEIRQVSSAAYIHPLSKFEGAVVRDDNDVIVGIVFDEQ